MPTHQPGSPARGTVTGDQRTTVRALPRQLRNFTVLTVSLGFLFTAFNGVLLVLDPTHNATMIAIVVFISAMIMFSKANVRLRRGDRYVEHRFIEFPIVVGIFVAPPYTVAFSMGMLFLLHSLWRYIRYREERHTIPQEFGVTVIAFTIACYLGATYPPFTYVLGAFSYTLIVEAFTFGYDLIRSGRAYAMGSLKENLKLRLLVAAALSVAVTALTLALGLRREVMVALPVTAFILYWVIQWRADDKDEKESWQRMESISSKFIGELEEPNAIALALGESLKLFAARRAMIVLPGTVIEAGSRWTLEAGPHAHVKFDIVHSGDPFEQRPEPTRYSQVIDLTSNNRTFGYMVIEWDEMTPEKRKRPNMNNTFGHAVALSIANTRHTKNLTVQAAEKAREAERDPLTGLGNRSMLSERGPALLSEHGDFGDACALLLFDLDNFKRINDTLGHAAGDEVLVEVARRIQDTVREDDLAIRLGGDEFAVLAVGLKKPAADSEMLANKIQAALVPPIEVEDLHLSVEASFGIALCPNDADSVEGLLKLADIAMYAAKGQGRGQKMRYEGRMDTNTKDALVLATDLRTAIYSTGELVLHYQPQVSLSTGKITGVEALVRWNHPEYGMLSPDRFVHIAERSNLVRSFTLTILRQALVDRAAMREVMPEATVSVNLSAQNLLDTGLPRDLQRLLDNHGVRPEELVLEVTETTTAKDVMAADRVLNDLADLGCLIAMDDFGSGYATMESMRSQSPIREIKIDKGFIENLATSDRDRNVAEAIIRIAHAWDCLVVAEGVEDEETYNHLRAMNCDVAQGYWLMRPAPLDKVMEWARERNANAPVTVPEPHELPG